jgi:hypothetical protein
MFNISLFGGTTRSGRRAGKDRRRAAEPVAEERRTGEDRRTVLDRRSEPRR